MTTHTYRLPRGSSVAPQPARTRIVLGLTGGSATIQAPPVEVAARLRATLGKYRRLGTVVVRADPLAADTLHVTLATERVLTEADVKEDARAAFRRVQAEFRAHVRAAGREGCSINHHIENARVTARFPRLADEILGRKIVHRAEPAARVVAERPPIGSLARHAPAPLGWRAWRRMHSQSSDSPALAPASFLAPVEWWLRRLTD